MFIRSERLFLRPGWPEDWQELLSRIADEGVVRNLAQVPWPYTADDARGFASKPQDARLPHFFVTLPTSSAPAELIGCVGLADRDGEIELGYWFAREHWGKGYATEAARAVLRLARVLGHRELVAGHFIDNPASGAVLRKVGFTPTGRLRQRFCLSRGYETQSVEHRITLGLPSDCDGGDDDVAAMRAA
jgi:RimJ/RimL family protein N-acetyltransferase